MNILHKIKASGIFLRDELLFPAHCCVCGIKCPAAICPQCERYLDFLDTALCCKICSASLGSISPDSPAVCSKCSTNLPYFRHISSSVSYNNVSARIVKRAKYSGGYMYLEYMADKISEHNTIPAKADLLTCVPMHPRELIFRHYDHNIILAKLLAQRLNIPFACIFDKVTAVKNQASLEHDINIRQKNIQNSFAVKKEWLNKLADKTIVICDDVTTTGATINELAKLVKNTVVWGTTFANAGYAPSKTNMLLL